MIGAMLDEQAEDLRSSLENDGIIVENTGEFLRVTMPGGLLFASDSAAVQPSVLGDLRAVARNLTDTPTAPSPSPAIPTIPDRPNTTRPCRNAGPSR